MAGRKYGDITNTMGNLMGMGDGSSAYRAQVRSNRGYYYLEFSKKYRGVSELDIELKDSYALDLISEYVNVPKDFLRLVQKKEQLTTSSLDTVYFVKQGTATIGKMSVSVRRYGKINELLFIYQKKHLRPKTLRGGVNKSTDTTKTEAKIMKRKNNRKNKNNSKRTL